MERKATVTEYKCKYGHKFTYNEKPESARKCPQCNSPSTVLDSYQINTTAARVRKY